MNAPCTDGDKDDWQKAVVALSRAAGGYSALMVEAGGNRAEAASLLWKRSRHDEALREDLVKAACALLALAPPVARHEGEAPALGWRRRPGRLSKCDLDPGGCGLRERTPGHHARHQDRRRGARAFRPGPRPAQDGDLSLLAAARRRALRDVIRRRPVRHPTISHSIPGNPVRHSPETSGIFRQNVCAGDKRKPAYP